MSLLVGKMTHQGSLSCREETGLKSGVEDEKLSTHWKSDLLMGTGRLET